MNEVFTNVTERVNEHLTAYKAKMDEERAHLRRYEAAAPAAAKAADDAITANDMKAWKKADQDKHEAEAGIRFTNARIEALKKERPLPLEKWAPDVLAVRCEYAAAVIAYVKKVRAAYDDLLEEAKNLDAFYDETYEVLRFLGKVAGERDDDYKLPAYNRTSWAYNFEQGRTIPSIKNIDINADVIGNYGDPLTRNVQMAMNVLKSGREAGVINE